MSFSFLKCRLRPSVTVPLGKRDNRVDAIIAMSSAELYLFVPVASTRCYILIWLSVFDSTNDICHQFCCAYIYRDTLHFPHSNDPQNPEAVHPPSATIIYTNQQVSIPVMMHAMELTYLVGHICIKDEHLDDGRYLFGDA